MTTDLSVWASLTLQPKWLHLPHKNEQCTSVLLKLATRNYNLITPVKETVVKEQILPHWPTKPVTNFITVMCGKEAVTRGQEEGKKEEEEEERRKDRRRTATTEVTVWWISFVPQLGTSPCRCKPGNSEPAAKGCNGSSLSFCNEVNDIFFVLLSPRKGNESHKHKVQSFSR